MRKKLPFYVSIFLVRDTSVHPSIKIFNAKALRRKELQLKNNPMYFVFLLLCVRVLFMDGYRPVQGSRFSLFKI